MNKFIKKITIISLMLVICFSMTNFSSEAAYGRKLMPNITIAASGPDDPEGAVFTEKSAILEEKPGSGWNREKKLVCAIDTSGWNQDYKVSFNWLDGENNEAELVTVDVNKKVSVDMPKDYNGFANAKVVDSSGNKVSRSIVSGTYTWFLYKGFIEINYEDEKGNKLLDSKKIEGYPDDKYPNKDCKIETEEIEGYNLFEVKGKESGVFIDNKYEETPVITYVYKKSPIVVNFEPEGGKFTDGTTDKKIVEIANKGDKASNEKITKNSYIFKGWYLDKEFKEKYDFDTPVMKDITLYAKWEKNTSTGGGGSSHSDRPKNATAILANGKKYTDVLTATVLANEKNCPILLTDTDNISTETLNELKRRGIGDVIISGGKESVSEKVVNKLNDFNVIRISGANRYETAREIGKEVRNLTGKKESAVLVDGTNFPDVITISALASQRRVPIMITEPNKLNSVTEKTLKDWNIKDVTIGGSVNSVSVSTQNKLTDNKLKVDRLGGFNRYETASLIGNEVRKITGNKRDMILVDGTNFPDGITINSLASKYKCPIHLTNPNKLTGITEKDIFDWNINSVLVGGGENSVSNSVYENLKANNKERISGADRYLTAIKISQKLDKLSN